VRLRLDLSYDGTDFHGWADQPGQRTVAGTLSGALTTVLRLADPPALAVAGRTDAGVHATGQVAHVDLDEAPDLPGLRRRLAGVLPADVVVRSVEPVGEDFHARFSARARHYRYEICDGVPDPLQRHRVLAWPRQLDAVAMHHAAQSLVGDHDFVAFCKARAGVTSQRRLLSLTVGREGHRLTVAAGGSAFCHHQVRSMVGALLAVGDGRRAADWPGSVLHAGVPDGSVTVAPAHGLTLVRVDY
jgi:tRNA pseudouridine38-40 synthase